MHVSNNLMSTKMSVMMYCVTYLVRRVLWQLCCGMFQGGLPFEIHIRLCRSIGEVMPELL
jgi:hypothetical protein